MMRSATATALASVLAAACAGSSAPTRHTDAAPRITIAVANPTAARAFYRDSFGLGARDVGIVGPDAAGVTPPTSLGGTTVGLLIYTDDVDGAVARAVARGATSRMRVRHMWWGDRYGQVIDPWGHRWGVARRIEAVAPAEQTRRLAQLRAGRTPDLGAADPAIRLPAIYRHVIPVLVVPDAAAAADHYLSSYGARELFRVAEPTGEIAHIELVVDGRVVMLDREHPSLYPRSPSALRGTTAAISIGAATGALHADPFGHAWRAPVTTESVTRPTQ